MSQIGFARTSHGVKWILPQRDLGKARWVGVGAIVMGLFMLGFMAVWMGLPISGGVEAIRKGQQIGWLFIAFGMAGLAGVLAGLGLITVGIGILSNRTHSEVEIRRDLLISREHVMWFWRSKRQRLARVEQLTIGPALLSKSRSLGGEKQPDPMTSAFARIGRLSALRAGGPDMKDLMLAPGYPPDMLHELAEKLSAELDDDSAQRVKLMDDTHLDQPDARRVKIVDRQENQGVETSPAEQDARIAAEPPAGTRIVVEPNADGLTMHIPPVGLRKGGGGLFGFGLLWCGFMTVFTAIMVGAMLFGTGEVHSDLPGIWGPLIAVLFVLVFWAIGIGMLTAGWNMGRRRSIIDIVGDTLLVTRAGPLGNKQYEWRADRIGTIRMGPSGMETNHVPVMALLIEPNDGKTIKLMTGWSDDQLEWAAAVLRQGLQVRGNEADDIEVDDADAIAQPAGSQITVDRRDGMAMMVPPKGAKLMGGALLVGLIFGGIGLGMMGGVLYSQFTKEQGHVEWTLVGFIILWGTLFGGAGLAVMISGLVAATRRYRIDARRGRLEIERRGLFGRKTFTWPAERIASIEVADSGTQVGNTRWYQVRVIDTSGKKTKLATGRKTNELRWMVWEMRRATGVREKQESEKAEKQKMMA